MMRTSQSYIITKNTLTYPRRENVTFVEPNMLPSNNPDLNPVAYAVRNALQWTVYRRRRLTSVEQLQQSLSGANSRSVSLTVSTMNGVAGWNASSSSPVELGHFLVKFGKK